MKYIMFKTDEGAHYPFIFPEKMTHLVMNDPLVYAIHKSTGEYAQPVSAGFVSLGIATELHGLSESMQMTSQPYDTALAVLGPSVSHMPTYMLQDLLTKARSKAKRG